MDEMEAYDPVRDQSGTCAKCGAVNKIRRHPGRFSYCYACGTIQLWMGKMRDAPCIDGGGSVYSHMQYVRGFGDGSKSVCAFCGRSEDEPLPEWPELDVEDLLFSFSTFPNDNAVRLMHLPTGVGVEYSKDKSRLKNKAGCLKLLRERLKAIPIGGYECPTR
jgi:hypothetical protein